MAYPSKTARNKEIIRKYEKGWSFRKIGEFYNIHQKTVYEVVQRWQPVYGKKHLTGVVDKAS